MAETLRQLGLDRTRARKGAVRPELTPSQIRGLLADVATGGGVPFIDAASQAAQGNYGQAAISGLLDAPPVKMAGMVLAPLIGMVRKSAPMDEALRIAQKNAAKPVSEGGLGLPPDNTPMNRARAMGFDTNVYHATVAKSASPVEEEFNSLVPSKRGKIGPGVYTSFDPNYAERYAEGIGSRVIPLLTKGVMAPSQVVDDVSQSVIQQLRKNDSIIDVPEWKRATNEELRNLGYSGRDVGKERLIFDPKNLRSRFAAFDPARINENNLLASLAALGIGVPVMRGLLQEEEMQ